MHSAIHDPHAVATPSERLFAERKRQCQERIDRAGKLFASQPPKPLKARPFSPTTTTEIVFVPEPIEQWIERQKKIHGKPPWFFIVADLGPTSRGPSITDILRAVIAEFPGITVADINSPCRMQRVVRPRMIAMYLAKVLTIRTLPELGRHFGKDHTTILHSVRKIENLILTDHVLDALIVKIKTSVAHKQSAEASA
jgi:Bacterial dnaA protein helix-turn-helix